MSTPTIVDDLTVTTYTKRHGQWFARVSGPLNMDSKLARQRAAKAIRAEMVASGREVPSSFRVATRVLSERIEGAFAHSYLITEA